jgi:hypothetical protein
MMNLTKLAMLDKLAKIRPDLYVLLTRAALAEAAGAPTDFDALMTAGFETLLERLENEPGDRDVLWARFDLDDFAREHVFGVIPVTELEPDNGKFFGKTINPDGTIEQYPNVTWFKQSVEHVFATVQHLYGYLRVARERNVCIIRDAPANVKRRRTRRQIAGVVGDKDRGDHGFLDVPNRLLSLDIDGVGMEWQADPEGAVKRIVAMLGEPWNETSFVWFFSATHGLEFETVEKQKRWTGRLSDGTVRVRIAFVTERPLGQDEAKALTLVAKGVLPKVDASLADRVHINYIKRPRWTAHPERDVLGNFPTIGYVLGKRACLPVPADLEHKARWSKAQGELNLVADHPDAESAVRGIGSDGGVYPHLLAAAKHLLNANPKAKPNDIVAKVRALTERHRSEVSDNLARHGRSWTDVTNYLADDIGRYTQWLIDHGVTMAKGRKRIRLIKEEARREEAAEVAYEEICKRVAKSIERVCSGDLNPFQLAGLEELGVNQVELCAAPTGSHKSTEMRAQAVAIANENASAVMLVPRHSLGREQIERLTREHPDYDGGAAVWRGMHADDPDAPDPEHPGKFLPMCRRSEEAKEVEQAKLSVESNLCKKGRGKKTVKCPLYELCGFQGQKLAKAKVWFAAHECAVHRKPKALGDIELLMIDESPLDAFVFGVADNDRVELELDALRGAVPAKLSADKQNELKFGRDALYAAFDSLELPENPHLGAPLTKKALDAFMERAAGWHVVDEPMMGVENVAHRLRALEWSGKVEPKISPAMTAAQVRKALMEAAGNATVAKFVQLWTLIEEATTAEGEACGRVQVHRGVNGAGRVIRMVGLRPLVKSWKTRTLICDATGDAALLRAIWPRLTAGGKNGKRDGEWPELPRPGHVQVFQCVDRAIGKWSVAPEGEGEVLERREKAARRMYAALLRKALEYGGEHVAAIVYKSTREWIERNCFVPDWLTLMHHGDVTGTNKLERVRALFVVGRALPPAEAVTRQTEALFGDYIAQREYVPSKGLIPIVPDAAGHTAIEVDMWVHTNAMAEKLRWQACEGGVLQAVGRARAGLRKADEPLDIHLWTDVPVPELGLVVPFLWDDVAVGLDGVMLAARGWWFENMQDAERFYPGLVKAKNLKQDRFRGGEIALDADGSALKAVRYQRAGQGVAACRALFLSDVTDPRAALEAEFGPLAVWEVEGPK